MRKILIIVGGGTNHLAPFEEAARRLNIDLTTASFSDLEYLGEDGKVVVKVKGEDLTNFGIVYIRLVGKSKEETSLLVGFCKDNRIRVVDKAFMEERFSIFPIPKSIEAKILINSGVSFPKTFFGRLEKIIEKGPEIFGYPFVIKGTTGKQGHAVWSPRNEDELSKMVDLIKKNKKTKKMKFIAQEFLKASQRSRVFVIGDRVIGGITRPTRWRKRFVEKVDGQYPEGKRESLNPMPQDQANLAIAATKALSLEVAGADVLVEDKTGKLFIIEVNSAPRWASIKKDTGINIEEEIIKYLKSL
jgi:RimK family alpha-L-glutamate ligase